MDEYALVPSLIAQVRALQDIVDGLDDRIERAKDLALSAQSQSEVAAQRARDAARLSQIVAQAQEPDAAEEGAPSAPRHARRDRHGLHVVRGSAAAAALAVGRWVARPGAHKTALATAVLAAVGGGVTVAGPSLMPRPPVPRPPVVAHHHHARSRRWQPAPGPAGPPAGASVSSARSHRDADDTAASARQHSVPAPAPSIVPTPAVTPTLPVPTLPPVPSPGPANTPPGDMRQVVRWVLRVVQ